MRAVLPIVGLLVAVTSLHGAMRELDRRELAMPGGTLRRDVLVDRGDVKYPLRRVSEELRLDPLTGRTNRVRRSETIGDHIMVKLRPGVAPAALDALNRAHGAYIRRAMLSPGMYLVAARDPDLDCMPRLQAAYAAASDLVMYAEPDPVLELQDTTPDDPRYLSGELWGHDRIQCPAAWDIEHGTGGVVVAVIDTGIDYTHPDLASNVWVNPGESGFDSNGMNRATNGVDDDANGFIDDLHGWDFHNDDHDPWDGHGHGTRCAGHFGAVGSNGIGVAGVCWDIRIMALKLYSDAGQESATPVSDAIDCFAYVSLMHSKGIKVRLTNNSWHSDYSQGLDDAVARHRQQGILCVGTAGNRSENVDLNPVYPACFPYDNVLSVTGSDKADALYHPQAGVGVTNVDLAAPAVDILSTQTGGGYTPDLPSLRSGTSRSAPFVAGVAALAWELAPLLSHQQVRQAILDGVDVVPGLAGKVATGGRLNAYGALLRVPPVIDHHPLVNTTNLITDHNVTAHIQPRLLLGTNAPLIVWGTGTVSEATTTNVMAWVANDVFATTLPGQPLGTEISYYLFAETTNGIATFDPTNAPVVRHTFRVVPPVDLVIAGNPSPVGLPNPAYGTHAFPSGVVVAVSAPPWMATASDRRHGLQGWTGVGDVPVNGFSNRVTFTLGQSSTCTWQWATEYALAQSSSVTGLLDETSWWVQESTGQTATAAARLSLDGTHYQFAGWALDGARQPDASNQAVNPVSRIAMTTSRTAQALYLDAAADSDSDALADSWEHFNFGTLDLTATNDPDNDTALNGDEQVAGTDPTDAADRLVVSQIMVRTNDIILAWPSVSGRVYGIDAQLNLGTQDWSTLTSAIPAQVPLNVTTTDVDQAVRFYRVTVEEE